MVARRISSLASITAAVAAGGILFSRLIKLGLAPYIQQEPKLLLTAWQQIESGDWATFSTLSGTDALRFGPTPLWFSALIQALVSRDAVVYIGCICAITCFAQLLFVFVLQARSPVRYGTYWELAGVLLVVASAPYELFWSRTAGDVFVNFGAFFVVAVLASDDLGLLKGALIGVLLGLCVSAHPIAIPFALAVVFSLLVTRMGPFGSRTLTLAAACAALVLVNLPWIFYLRGAELPALPTQSLDQLHLTAARFLDTFRPHSISGLAYVFDDDWSAFRAAHPLVTKIDWQRYSLIASGAVTISGLSTLLTQRMDPGLRRVGLVGVLCAVAYPILRESLQLNDDPAYQFPTAWLTVAAAAGVFYARSFWMVPFRLVAVVLAVVNLAFIWGASDFIAKRNGTRGPSYGTPVEQQQELVRALCIRPGKTIHIVNQTAIFPEAFQQHFASDTTCRSKKLDFCGPDGCADAPSTDSVVRLEYREPEGGAIQWAVEPRAGKPVAQ